MDDGYAARMRWHVFPPRDTTIVRLPFHHMRRRFSELQHLHRFLQRRLRDPVDVVVLSC